MAKFIKTVKSKDQLRRLTETIPDGLGRTLLSKWIAQDPIYVGTLSNQQNKLSLTVTGASLVSRKAVVSIGL